LLSSAVRRGDPELLIRVGTEVVDRLGEEIQKLRGLIVELRPAALDELGLEAAVDSLADRYEVTTGLEVARKLALCFEAGTSDSRLDPDVEATAYRVVQEALTNVAKHGRAERVWITLTEANGWLDLEVRDDGVGFDPSDQRGHGFGLTGMRERIGLAGGRIEVESAPGTGTRLRAVLPAIHPSDEDGEAASGPAAES
jgi:signal transduction histidine kinase